MKKIFSFLIAALSVCGMQSVNAQTVDFGSTKVTLTEADGSGYERFQNKKQNGGAFETIYKLDGCGLNVYSTDNQMKQDKTSLQVRNVKGTALIIDGLKEGQTVLVKTKGLDNSGEKAKDFKVTLRHGTVTQDGKTISNYGGLEANKEFTVGAGTTYVVLQLTKYDRVFSISVK